MPRVELRETMFQEVINDRGQDCLWERAIVCNCLDKSTGQPHYNCPICHGSGFRYLPGQPIRVLITSMMSNYKLELPEFREPGTAYVTPSINVIMGYRDRLIFPEFKCLFSEILRFSTEDYGKNISAKTYRDIKSVEFLMDENNQYSQGEDFEIASDNFHIIWKNPDIDVDGKSFSLLYYTSPSYLVTDILHELRATLSMRKTTVEKFVELPKQYKVNREDFVYGISNSATENSELGSSNNSEGVLV